MYAYEEESQSELKMLCGCLNMVQKLMCMLLGIVSFSLFIHPPLGNGTAAAFVFLSTNKTKNSSKYKTYKPYGKVAYSKK